MLGVVKYTFAIGFSVGFCIFIASLTATGTSSGPPPPYSETHGIEVIEVRLEEVLPPVQQPEPQTETQPEADLTEISQDAETTPDIREMILDIPPLPALPDIVIASVEPTAEPPEVETVRMDLPPTRPARIERPRVSRPAAPAPAPQPTASPNTGTQPTETNARAEAQARAALERALANYPNQVVRKIRNTRQRGRARAGQVHIQLQIAANGALASARIVRSSGNSQTDQMALGQIQRAAPFPPTPDGNGKSYTLPVVVR